MIQVQQWEAHEQDDGTFVVVEEGSGPPGRELVVAHVYSPEDAQGVANLPKLHTAVQEFLQDYKRGVSIHTLVHRLKEAAK